MGHRRHRRRTFAAWLGLVAIASALTIGATVRAQPGRTANNPIAELDRRIGRGEATLEYTEGAGYLPSLLAGLGVRADSQVLVFSKTSFQQSLINPANPRAIYFNDTVSVGTVPGGEVYELTALDPDDGIAFYSLPIERTERPRFQRRGVECLFCHSPGNKGAPALVVASVSPGADGTPAYTGTFIGTIDHRTPLSDRWGGWYVTGTSGSQAHMGNAYAPDPGRPFDLQPVSPQHPGALPNAVDRSKYLALSSDIVALMTLEHQVGATNRINALSVQYRRTERAGLIGDAEWKHLDAEIDDLVGYLLFVDEAPLRDRVTGSSTFARTFAARGPRDRLGRSLRDFDLVTRTFRYPLSFMVYSDQFDAMPSPVRTRVYQRLHDVLTGADTSPKYAALSAGDREAVLEILADTKARLAEYWPQP